MRLYNSLTNYFSCSSLFQMSLKIVPELAQINRHHPLPSISHFKRNAGFWRRCVMNNDIDNLRAERHHHQHCGQFSL